MLIKRNHLIGSESEAFGIDWGGGGEGADGLGEAGAEVLDEGVVCWVVGEVEVFVGVGGVIVEFATFLSLIPLDVAVAFGGDGAAHDLGEFVERGGGGFGGAGEAEDLGEGGAGPGGFGIFEEGMEGGAFEGGGWGEAGEVAEGGEEIDEFDDALAGFAALGGGDLRGGDEEGGAGGFVKEGAFLPEAVLAEVVAVVAPEDDGGGGPELVLVEGVEEEAELGIDEGDAGVVGLEGFAEGGFGEVVAGGEAVVGEGGGGNVVAAGVGKFWEVDLVEGMGFEIGFGGDEGGVGAEEAGGEEEGSLLFGEGGEALGGFAGDQAVGLFGVGAVGGEPTEGGGDGFFGGGVGDEGFVGDVAAFGVEDGVPGGGIVEAVGADAVGDVVVVDFADAVGGAAGLAVELGEGDGVGEGVAEVAVEVVNLGGVGAEAGEDGGAGGVAEGDLAVCAFEEEAAGVEAVEVGGGEAWGAGAVEDVAEVVDGDEEDVLGGGGGEG